MTAPAITIRHLSKSYGALPALQDLNLTLRGGQIVGLLVSNCIVPSDVSLY